MVAVVAAVGGEVEGHREPHLTGGEVGAVEGVRLLGGREARVLPDRPRPVGVHRGPHAAEERVEPGERVDGFEILEVGRGVQGLHRDALGRDPCERRRIALQLLRRERLPVGDGPVRASRSVISHGERVEVASSGHELVTRRRLGATRAVLSSPGARLRRCGRGRRRPRGPGGQRPRRPCRHGACWSRGPSRPRRRRAGRGCFRCDAPAAAWTAGVRDARVGRLAVDAGRRRLDEAELLCHILSIPRGCDSYSRGFRRPRNRPIGSGGIKSTGAPGAAGRGGRGCGAHEHGRDRGVARTGAACAGIPGCCWSSRSVPTWRHTWCGRSCTGPVTGRW